MHYIYTLSDKFSQLQTNRTSQRMLTCMQRMIGQGGMNHFIKNFGNGTLRKYLELGDYFSRIESGYSAFICINDDNQFDFDCFKNTLLVFLDENEHLVEEVSILLPDELEGEMDKIKDILTEIESKKVKLSASRICKLEDYLGLESNPH